MAYVVDTAMQEYILNSNSNLDYHELNRGRNGAFQLGMDLTKSGMAPLSEGEVVSKIKTLSNVPKIAVMNRDGVSLSAVRTAVPKTATFGTTAFVNITRATVEAVIKYVPSIHGDNAVDGATYLQKKIRQAIQEMKSQMEASIITDIDAAKSQVSASSYPFVFDATADAYLVDVPAGVTAIDDINKVPLQWIEALNAYYMADDLTENPIAVLSSPSFFNAYAYGARFKDNNSENLNQIMTGLAPYGSSAIAEGGGTPVNIGTAYAIAPNCFGLYTWVSEDARANRVGTNGSVTAVFLPELGAEVELFTTATHEDLSATFGAQYEQVYAETISFALDFVTVLEYNSAPTTVAKAIKKALWRDNA